MRVLPCPPCQLKVWDPGKLRGISWHAREGKRKGVTQLRSGLCVCIDISSCGWSPSISVLRSLAVSLVPSHLFLHSRQQLVFGCSRTSFCKRWKGCVKSHCERLVAPKVWETYRWQGNVEMARRKRSLSCYRVHYCDSSWSACKYIW